MNGIIAQLLSMLMFGTSNALWRKPISKLVVQEAIIYRTVFSVLFFIVLLLTVDDGGWQVSNTAWGINIWVFASVVSCLSYFGLFFFNKALQQTSTGMVVIVVTSSYLFGQFTSFVMLGESPSKGYIIPFSLFIIAILVSDYKSVSQFKISKGVWFALLASMFWGITLPLLSIPAKQIGYVKTGLVLELSVMFMSFLGLKLMQKQTLNLSRFKNDLSFFILLGCLAGGGVLFNNLSYTKIPVYIAGSISSVTHIVSIFAARILFSEKLKLYQYLAAGISVIAIFILTSQ